MSPPLKSKSLREKLLRHVEEKSISSLTHSPDGLSVLTGGEDGVVRLWSSTGDPRATILSLPSPIHSIDWTCNFSTTSSSFVAGTANCIILKTLSKNSRLTIPQNSKSQVDVSFPAHKHFVSSVKCHPYLNLVASIGGDSQLKLWDFSGRLVSESSLPLTSPTSLSWSPTGDVVAVGGYEYVALFDKLGSCIRVFSFVDEPALLGCGSIINLKFNFNSIVCQSFQEQEVILPLSGSSVKTCDFELIQISSDTLILYDFYADRDFKLSSPNSFKYFSAMGKNVIAINQDNSILCYQYSNGHMGLPNQLQSSSGLTLTDDVLIAMSSSYLCLLATSGILKVYSLNNSNKFDLRVFSGASSINTSGKSVLSITNQIVSVVDGFDCQSIRLFDLDVSKPVMKPFRHSSSVIDVKICPFPSEKSPAFPIILAFLDSSKNLYILDISSSPTSVKIASNVSCFCFHQSAPILCYVSGFKLFVLPCPGVLYTDDSLHSDITIDVFSQSKMMEPKSLPPSVKFFTDVGVTVSCPSQNGDHVVDHVIPIAHDVISLIRCVEKKQLSGAVRIATLLQKNSLWSLLAALSVSLGKLNISEICYSKLGRVDRVMFLKNIRSSSSPEIRKAELLLFKKKFDKAEKLFVTSGFKFRAIELHIRFLQWEAALDLALNLKSHVDTVLALRQQYLKKYNEVENLEKFLKYSKEVTIDWSVIEQKIKSEKEREMIVR
ncbi:hypothetical protein GEMRC1_011853 [Eukaryota sp. GEM-RC1]